MYFILSVCLAAITVSCTSKKMQSGEFTFMTRGDVYNRPYWESVARQYNKTNPVKKVKIFAPPAQYYDKLVVMAAGNNLCDLTLMAFTEFDLLAFKDQLLPLDDILKRDDFKTIIHHIMPSSIAQGKRRGIQYGMPIWAWTVNWYYNKSLLNKYGIGEPNANWNWTDFLQICKKITHRDNVMDRSFGLTGMTGSHSILHEIILKQNDLSLFSQDMQKCIINSPQHLKMYQFFFDMTRVHKITVTAAESESVTSGAGQGGAFGSGMVGFTTGGREQADILTKANLPFNWDIVKMPTDFKDVYVTANTFVGISKHSLNKDGAVSFLKWLISEQGQRLITLRRMDIAVYKPLTYSPEYENMLGMRRVNMLFRESIEKAVPADQSFPNIQEFREIQKINYELVNQGNLDAREALYRIAKAYDKLKN